MTQAEFARWVEFYRMSPFDDLHRYHRPAALVAGAAGGAKVPDLLEWLAPEPVPAGLSKADLQTMKALGIKPPQGKR